MTNCIFLILVLLLSGPAYSEQLKEVSIGKHNFHVNSNRFNRMNSESSSNFIIFENKVKSNARAFAPIEIQEIPSMLLTVTIMPLHNAVVYITFPDAGNMLVILDSNVNPLTILPILDELMTKKKKEASLMKVIGWKPRLDWLVITDNHNSSNAILESIINKFDVEEIITPTNTELVLKKEIKHIKLQPDEAINLMQTAATIKMTSFGTKKINKNYLVLSLAYVDFSFLFLPEMPANFQKTIYKKYAGQLDNQIFITYNAEDEPAGAIYNKPSPGMIVSGNSKIKFITGGKMLYLTESDKNP
ncbi:hypothetical protein ACFLR5_01095 [Elusimicrobiota bacterium]